MQKQTKLQFNPLIVEKQDKSILLLFQFLPSFLWKNSTITSPSSPFSLPSYSLSIRMKLPSFEKIDEKEEWKYERKIASIDARL